MIKNERQFKLTRSQVQRFEDSLADLRSRDTSDIHPVQQDLELRSIASTIAELEAGMRTYVGLRDGEIAPVAITDVASIPRALIEHRIAAGLSQRELAERLDLKEQQIQRYEAEDWATASLSRLVQVADALGIASTLPEPSTSDLDEIRRTVGRVGIDREFLTRRLAPAPERGLAAVVDLTARLNRVYRWTPAQIINGEISEPEPLLEAASFKLPKEHNAARTNAYTVYSHYLALQALAATPNLEPRQVPVDPDEMRRLLDDGSETISFERAITVAWSLGVIVMPLADPGAFHAMLWRFEGRNVVILKQQNRLVSRWLFDLLHELRHAAEDPGELTYAVLDGDGDLDEDEYEANNYAGAVLLAGRAEELAQQVARASGGRVETLTRVVPEVARRNNVSTGDLAHYLAYRLSIDGVNWWGAATNLQSSGDDPWRIAAEKFFEEIDLRLLNPIDRDLLIQAISDPE